MLYEIVNNLLRIIYSLKILKFKDNRTDAQNSVDTTYMHAVFHHGRLLVLNTTFNNISVVS